MKTKSEYKPRCYRCKVDLPGGERGSPWRVAITDTEDRFAGAGYVICSKECPKLEPGDQVYRRAKRWPPVHRSGRVITPRARVALDALEGSW